MFNFFFVLKKRVVRRKLEERLGFNEKAFEDKKTKALIRHLVEERLGFDEDEKTKALQVFVAVVAVRGRRL